jgi:predicted amidophosphoribosyltransferase
MEETICPFCNKAIRSDANAPEFCALCGMGVDHPESAPSINTVGDQFLYFCCTWCLRLYVREVKHSHDGPRGDGDDQGRYDPV